MMTQSWSFNVQRMSIPAAGMGSAEALRQDWEQDGGVRCQAWCAVLRSS